MLKYLLPALILESVMLTFLMHTPVLPEDVTAYIVLHAAASVLLAFAMREQIPNGRHTKKRWVLSYLFIFNFVMPVLGAACVIIGYHIARRFPHIKEQAPFVPLEEPSFTTHRNKEGVGFRGGQVRAQLMNARTPLIQKMEALVSIQETPARTTKDLLHTLLSDSADDIRMLAYGILDSKEKHIMHRILELQRHLEHARRSMERREVHRQLAELYWELIYQNLVQGDMRAFAGNKVRSHANQALQVQEDGGLWFLLARLELQMQRTSEASTAIDRARHTGFAHERLLPYEAQLYFLEKRYDDVRPLLMMMSSSGVPSLLPMLRYWLDVPFLTLERSRVRNLIGIPAPIRRDAPAGQAPAIPPIGPAPRRYT
jgi:hypothetical protein